MSDEIRVNINTMVSFKMTPAGEALWRAHLDSLYLSHLEYVKDSYWWPLWEVMSFFGPHTYNGMPSPLIQHNDLYFPMEVFRAER